MTKCPARDKTHWCVRDFDHDGAASVEVGTEIEHLCTCGRKWTQKVVK